MVHLLRSLTLVLAALLAASGCTPPSPQAPPPTPPVLVSGRVTGNQVCGPITTIAWGLIGAFGCVLPNTAPAAFLLTPATRITPRGTPEPNEFAILTVTTQSAKSLNVAVRLGPGGRLVPQHQFPAGSNVPQFLGNYGEVAVAATDDGATKTWTLTVRVNPCQEVTFLEIATVTPGGPISSTHLDVVLLRNQSEVQQTNCPVPRSRASLTSIAPNHGPPGSMVTLTGAGFSSHSVQVKFGNLTPIPATLDGTMTTTTVAVPQAVFGQVSVAIIDPAYGQTTPLYFTITGVAPVIYGIVPTHGEPGDLVTLSGVNFGSGMVIEFEPLAGGPMVTVAPELMDFSATSLRFRVPLVNVGNARVKLGYAGSTFSNVVGFVVDPASLQRRTFVPLIRRGVQNPP